MFKVPWVDDAGVVQVNRGYRVQFNNTLGPYKGGIRFHPSVNLCIMKFLAFEQVFKNALTGLPLGGAKGGSDFDPKGKSNREIMRFCQRFMSELYRHIGSETDVPAGDIGVSQHEIGYLYGMYKKLVNVWDGSLTGKSPQYGGSLIRKEATGYGLCYFLYYYLEDHQMDFQDKKVLISGSGNVATYACEKAQALGAKVIAMSDSKGVIYDENGIDLSIIKKLKQGINRRSIKHYLEYKEAEYMEHSSSIWKIPCDIALPCATQNEIDLQCAKSLVQNGCRVIGEGANMPCTMEATEYFLEHHLLFAPAKAANAGGVATSSLEMTQNKLGRFWSEEKVDETLRDIMKDIYHQVSKTARQYDKPNNLIFGANIASFIRVANAMIEQGIV